MSGGIQQTCDNPWKRVLMMAEELLLPELGTSDGRSGCWISITLLVDVLAGLSNSACFFALIYDV